MALTDITFLSGISPNPFAFFLEIPTGRLRIPNDITFGLRTPIVLQTRLISETIFITIS